MGNEQDHTPPPGGHQPEERDVFCKCRPPVQSVVPGLCECGARIKTAQRSVCADMRRGRSAPQGGSGVTRVPAGHYIIKCEGCDCVIEQCRCVGMNKEVRLGMCEKCVREIAETKADFAHDPKAPPVKEMYCGACNKTYRHDGKKGCPHCGEPERVYINKPTPLDKYERLKGVEPTPPRSEEQEWLESQAKFWAEPVAPGLSMPTDKVRNVALKFLKIIMARDEELRRSRRKSTHRRRALQHLNKAYELCAARAARRFEMNKLLFHETEHLGGTLDRIVFMRESARRRGK